MNAFPRESVEFQPVTVKVDGVPVTDGVLLALAPPGSRPVTWVAPTVLEERIGVMINGLAPGRWIVWAKVVALPETVVVDCGTFEVT